MKHKRSELEKLERAQKGATGGSRRRDNLALFLVLVIVIVVGFACQPNANEQKKEIAYDQKMASNVAEFIIDAATLDSQLHDLQSKTDQLDGKIAELQQRVDNDEQILIDNLSSGVEGHAISGASGSAVSDGKTPDKAGASTLTWPTKPSRNQARPAQFNPPLNPGKGDGEWGEFYHDRGIDR
jgi:TolA-binding protein